MKENPYTNRELDVKFQNLSEQIGEGFRLTHARQDKTNGNVLKNTEHRQQMEGVFSTLKLLGVANIVTLLGTIATMLIK